MSIVYFIKPVALVGPIKIGCSGMIRDRFKSLDGWSPLPLEMVASVDGDRQVECRFHIRFQHLRERGEWFTAAPELREVIAQIQGGAFDVESLPPFGEKFGWRGPRPPEVAAKIRLANQLTWLEKRGVKIPARIKSARRFSGDPDEERRRWNVIATFVDTHRPKAA